MPCPICHSDDVQKLRLVYEFGTIQIHITSHIAAGLYRGDWDGSAMSVLSFATRKTVAAHIASPPRKRSYRLSTIMLAVSCFVFWAYCSAGYLSAYGWLCLAIILLVLAILVGIKAYRYNSREWPDLYMDWNRLWYCRKCGTEHYKK